MTGGEMDSREILRASTSKVASSVVEGTMRTEHQTLKVCN